MPRPATIDNEEILKVAKVLFLQRGPDVPTAEIARALGISEGSIFKRYSTKQDLFFAAMTHCLPSWLENVDGLVGQNTVRANITTIAKTGVTFFQEMLPRMMMLWSRQGVGPLEFFSAEHRRAGPIRGLAAIKGYFEAEQALGRIDVENCEILARMLVGSIFHFTFSLLTGLVLEDKPIPVETFAEQVAESLWRGVRPSDATVEDPCGR
jgi:AcrR family transcriptional regulator